VGQVNVNHFNRKTTLVRSAQLAIVLLCALALKFYYSSASPDQLRWILAPTTFLVQLISGRSFAFESHAGYLSSDRTFLIAASCAGVNFLITSFLMLSLRKLWVARSRGPAPDRMDNPPDRPTKLGWRFIPWRFIPTSLAFAYLATLVTNAVRISIALQLQRMPVQIGGLTANQIHRFEGIIVYFGFLLLLFVVSDKLDHKTPSRSEISVGRPSLFRRSLFPLGIYYATTLGIPLANSIYHEGIAAPDFWEHSLFVLLTPLLVIVPFAAFRALTVRTKEKVRGKRSRKPFLVHIPN
jgi:hypothetical protein